MIETVPLKTVHDRDISRIAIIPARGGSKRLPGKNRMLLGGKPLIAWTIEAAIESGQFDEVLVSTDDAEIAEISKVYGASVPFLRPPGISGDNASSFDVVAHALDFYARHQKAFDEVMLLQPTSPLRNADHIIDAILLAKERGADAVVSVSESGHNPLWCGELDEDGDMSTFLDKNFLGKRSQDLPVFYCLNGAIYLCKTKRLLQEQSFLLSNNIYAFKIQRECSIDIDERIDFELASLLIEKCHKI